MKNKHSVINIMRSLQKGEKPENIQKEIDLLGKKRAKEEGKCLGECESCGEMTVLVEEVGLCGPCCFGESETYNGNF